jgi:radical SAM superfamily enzyme YgiQ (UPF0313 family)
MNSFCQTGNSPHALLLQPPPGDLTGPYPALCYLKSYAATRNLSVTVRDLGIEAFHYLSARPRLDDLTARADALIRDLENRTVLHPAHQQRYRMLLNGKAVRSWPAQLQRALDVFRDPSIFYSHRRYRRACRLLDAFFGLVSAVHFPTEVTPSTYPTAIELQTMSAILAHRQATINPYIAYYKNILFPQIAAAAPPVIGLSMVFASQSVQALVLGNLIKKRFPDVHVTLGGAYLSQWVMTMQAPQLADLFRCADSVICGEGEVPFADLVERVVAGRSLDGIANCIRPRNGTARFFDHMIYTDVPSQPPPDYSDLDLSGYLTPEVVLPYCISRGCYWGRCVFCQNRYGDHQMRRYQTVPVEKALAEMQDLAARHRSTHFNFSNDVVDPAYLKTFSQALIASGASFTWNTDLRAEKAFTPEICRQLARAGLNCVAIGFESGCQKTLDAMDKGNRVETTRRVFKNFYDAGIATQAMGMFGFPGETLADGKQTVAFLEENLDCISYYVMGLLMVMPGSRMHASPQDYGITSLHYASPLRIPQPVWKCHTRMPIAAVRLLYQRLARLESVFSIDEYPYVGGLSTNHGFLYYQRGPDRLKQIRSEQNAYLRRVATQLERDENTPSGSPGKRLVPRWAVPLTVYRIAFPIDRIHPAGTGPVDGAILRKGTMQDFLLEPVHGPMRIGAPEIGLLRRINGRRHVAALLKSKNAHTRRRSLRFLSQLIQMGWVDV